MALFLGERPMEFGGWVANSVDLFWWGFSRFRGCKRGIPVLAGIGNISVQRKSFCADDTESFCAGGIATFTWRFCDWFLTLPLVAGAR